MTEPRLLLAARFTPHVQLIVVLVGSILFLSFLPERTFVARIAIDAVLLAIFFGALRSLAHSRLALGIACGAAVMGVVGTVLIETAPPAWVPWGSWISLTGNILLFTLLLATLARRVFAEGPVNSERIAGAIGIYLVIGLLWAFAYGVVEQWQPGSLNGIKGTADRANDPLLRDLIYFSYVTLTTLGYGDITPVNSQAKSLAIFEAIFGQLYLAVVLARLVGMQLGNVQPAGSESNQEGSEA